MKKTMTIILYVLAGVITALCTVILIIKSGQKMALSPLSSFIETSCVIPSSNVSISSEETTILKFSSPNSAKFTTTDDTVTFSGNYKKNYALTLDNEQIITDQNGNFTVEKPLQFGNNEFIFYADGQTKTFNIYKRYIVISSYSPSTKQIYSAGDSFEVTATARQGANVTATFNGITVTLSESEALQNGFSVFSGVFTLPTGHFKDLNLGKIKFFASYNEFSESFSSGDVTCKKEDIVIDFDHNATPKGGQYTNVGSGIITEIVGFQAETFTAGTKKDTSYPYNNYLPKGTLDYGSADTFTVTRDGDKYELITLRCGRTVYKSMRDKPSNDISQVAKQYVGLLPDHNEISPFSFENRGSHTVLTLNTLWKAPFYFNLLPQNYDGDYDITYNYVDITFCYATVFGGEITIPQDNPIFSSAKIIKNDYDYTLRLYLKKQGGFYGWDSYYNSEGQLCFEFLNPAKISQTTLNSYGADLSGVKILIDVGHGGKDVGASKSGVYESNLNLMLANKLKDELLSIGATVYMTRTDNVLSTTDDKLTMLKQLKPNYCIAIHHDSNKSSALNGFGSYYFTPFSKKASQFVLNRSFNTGIYKDKTFKFHKYYTARSSICPVVLTENGYISNSFDFKNMIDETANTYKAKALTAGIIEYFISIQ